MEGKKKRRIYTIIGICIAVSSLFFFLQIDGPREQLNVAQASLYRLFGILAIILGSVFVLLGLLKGHHKSHEL